MRRRAALVRTFVLWAAATTGIAALLAIAAGYGLGWRALTVMSGSMEPTVSTGDVVIVKQIQADDAQAGQVITFTDPEGRKKLITHRIRTVSLVGGRARFVTQGDSNTGVERWTVPLDGTIGLVESRIPKVGYIAAESRTRKGMSLLLIPILALAGLELFALWRPSPKLVPELPPAPVEGHP